jgi:predicted N-acetyltransferase YhbS
VAATDVVSIPSVSLRAPRDGDAAGMAALLGRFGYPVSAGVFARRLSRIGADPATVVLVADDGGSVIGLGAVHLIDILEGDRPLAVLIALAVDDRYQRRGVGRALVEALEAEAVARGSFGISVHSGKRRIGAHAFYRRLGYELTGERMLKLFAEA